MIDLGQLRLSIKNRTSVRTFDGKMLNDEHKRLIDAYLNQKENLIGFYGNEIKVQSIISKGDEYKAIATYGIIKHAPVYLVISCNKTKEAMIDCGYVIENLVLFLVSLGVGSCWMGGTFKRELLSNAIELGDNEFVPILLPIGYENVKKTLTDKAIRAIAKSHSREPFNSRFFMDDFTKHIVEPTLIEQLECVQIAPSASNKQPWRLVVEEAYVHFYLERTPNYDSKMLGYDIQMIDMGIALAHFNLVRRSIMKKTTIKNLSEISAYEGVVFRFPDRSDIHSETVKKVTVNLEYIFSIVND
jgi:nitroreductase